MSELTKALCAVMSDVGSVKETGYNGEQRYAYASDTDLLRAVQPAMARHGLVMAPIAVIGATLPHSDTKSGTKQWRTDLVIRYRLLHVGGEALEIEATGSGVDFGDKGPYKAMTGALKYALRHLLLIPTGDDAEIAPPGEKDEPGPPRPRPEPKAKPPPKPAAPPAAPSDAPHPSWEADKPSFFAEIGKIPNATAGNVADVLAKLNRPRASAMDSASRAKLLGWLASPAGQAALADAAAPEPGSEG